MPQKISIDTPLSELTLRRYEKPYHLGKRDLVRKFCLSVGLLQPGDSRDVVVDVLYVLLDAKKQKKELTCEQITKEVITFREQEHLALWGVASSNIRRQLMRLRKLFLVEKVKNYYRITEFSSLSETFEEKVQKFLLPSIINRVKEYYKTLDDAFPAEEVQQVREQQEQKTQV
ncbi:hypothetical protein HYW21_06095 [Candidatus Woesearchaeota archaeon]|nr:hypothetical protein [Candidatus Woesearchaeota archaeon]